MNKAKVNKKNIVIFGIIIILALITSAIFIRFHLITDTYWNMGKGYGKYKISPLRDGRIINYISLSIAQILNMPFEFYQLIMMITSIIFYSLSVYYIYKYLLDKLEEENILHRSILLLGSFLMIFNPMALESFAYTEMVIPLSILLLTKAAILLDKNSTIKPLILVIIACLAYQGTVNFFITLSILLFSIGERKSSKSWIKQISKIVFISTITLTIMAIIINLTNYIVNLEQTRIGQNDVSILYKIIGIITISMSTIAVDTFGLFPKYFITIYIAMTLIFILFSLKTKDITPILKYLFILFVAVFTCIVPIYIQAKPAISARLCFSIGAIIGISIIYVLFQNNTKVTEKILLTITIIAIFINIYDYINVGIMNIKTEEKEKEYISKINECMLEYEKTTGKEVTKVAFIKERKYENTYLNMPANTFTSKGMNTSYSNIHCFNYYTNRNLELADMNKEIFVKHFLNQDDNEFNKKQVQFKDDTMYVCIY